MSEITIEDIKANYRNVADFPKPGIQFKDFTTLLQNPLYFKYIVNCLTDKYKNNGITKVLGIESRGFIFGATLADRLNAGFVPIRKPGKLPYEKHTMDYKLEYGTDALEIHTDSLLPTDKVLLHDDLLATGGTAKASLALIRMFGITSVELCFIAELDFLRGRETIGDKYPVFSMIHF